LIAKIDNQKRKMNFFIAFHFLIEPNAPLAAPVRALADLILDIRFHV
jgi:hypothetical protein